MDKFTYVRKRLNREQWKAIIKECRFCGMTTTAWCKANGICEQTYYKHLKKLREEMIESLPSSITNAETDNKPAVFKRLEVQPLVSVTKPAVIIHLGNTIVEINNGTSRNTVMTCRFPTTICRSYGAMRWIMPKKNCCGAGGSKN